MRVLITFAVDAEFAPWRKRRLFNRIDFEDLLLWRTNSEGHEITVLLTGVGEQAATRAMGLMLRMADEDKHFDICISSGLAGALQQTLTPGNIIAPRMIRAAFQHADLKSDSLAVDQDLHEFALRQGAKATDCLFTTGQVLLTAKQKAECSAKGQSVDMESFEIVKEACAWGARCVVLRAVSDSADEDLPINFNLTLSKKSRISLGKVILQLARNPSALPALVRFGKQSRKAAEALAIFLDLYVSNLCHSRVEAAAITGAGK